MNTAEGTTEKPITEREKRVISATVGIMDAAMRVSPEEACEALALALVLAKGVSLMGTLGKRPPQTYGEMLEFNEKARSN